MRTPERAKILADAIGRGVPINHACAIANISRSSFLAWRNADPALQAAIELATAKGVESRMKILEDAAKKDWRAALAWLQLLPEFAKHRGPEHLNITQNNLVIPRELLDQIAETRRLSEQSKVKTIEA